MFKKIIFLLVTGILLFIVPGSDCEAIGPQGPSDASVPFTPPRAARSVLDNGLVLYALEDHELPLFHLSAVIRTGSAYDPKGKEGLAELTGTLMRTGGTKSLSGDEIDEALDFIACNIEVSTGADSMTIDLSVLVKDIDRGLQILSEMLRNPVFEDGKVTLARNLKIEELNRIRDDPVKLAFREFNEVMYRDNPRGRHASVKSVGNIQREDIVSFHEHFFCPENVMIALSGDIKTGEAVSKIRKYLGKWKANGAHDTSLPVPRRQKGGIFYVPKDIPQAVIVYGQLAPARRDEDCYPFTILDFILGSGGFQSFIVQEIRNNRGLAYSTGSFYKPKANHGVFAAYAMTKSSSTTEVLSLLRSVVEKQKERLLHDSTVAWAKKSIINRFIFSFLSSMQIARQEMMLEYEGLSDDYLVKYGGRIKKIQIKDLTNSAASYFVPEEAVIIVVGNGEVFNQLRAAFDDVRKVNCSSE